MAEESQTKTLPPEAVKRSDEGRDKAETLVQKRGPGRPRKDGSPAQPRLKTVDGIAKQVKSEHEAEKKKKEPKEVDSWREPSKADVRRMALMVSQINKPLFQLEKQLLLTSHQLQAMGAVQQPLVEPGEIVLSNDEIEFGSEMAAGTLMAISPEISKYIPVAGLLFWSLSILVSRGIVAFRVKMTLDGVRQAMAGMQPQNGQAPRETLQ